MNELAVAQLDELVDGQMKEITAGDTKILVARVGETVYAVGAVCPHYQAPLAKGLLCGHRLYCPWHHSSFDITNGNLLDPPSIDGLPTYPVRLEDGQIWVSLPDTKTPLAGNPDPEQIPADDRTVVILGGGAAGLTAAQTLRDEKFGGRVVMVTRENDLPYDRPKLSKNFLDGRASAEKVPLRSESFYEQNNIEVQVNNEVSSVDAEAHTITFADGDSMHFHALIAATGSTPNTLSVPGADKAGICTLRSFADARQIVEQLPEGGKAVVIGGSFIGLEVAASLRKRALQVTVVTPETVLFEKILGPEIGGMLQQLHETNGVAFHLGATVESFAGDEHVSTVLLDNGEQLPADIVIVGIGVQPNTDCLASLPRFEKDKSIIVDTYLQAAPDVFAVGDIAHFPDHRNGESPIRIEHWRTAQQHGIIAALNVLGRARQVGESVPFFWTNQYEKRLSYVGHADQWDEIIIHGKVAKQDFLAFYVSGNRILAVASMNRDQDSLAIEELMRLRLMPWAEEIKEKLPNFIQLVSEAK
ncbi:apoptosis inducing factor family protein [Fibrella forsythiae]|uniref:FAD-dependent oxidoreductase n=1 Tax=Fibrella forsythiae TaxID=2817061 RepID=A0ABS3JD82_9BACT|nr:apoptosis inducing factor family protein [Fibrella forsythiae]MBO0947951.1 FAD-dependent oxidoreductase [Fibrella forsythiae]